VNRKTERNEEIVRRHLDGEFMSALGREYGITRERVRQIVRRAGVTREESLDARRQDWTCGTCGKKERRRESDAARGYCSPECAAVARRIGEGPRSPAFEHPDGHLWTYDRRLGRNIRYARSVAGEKFREAHGRELERTEWVGHIDRDPKNCDLENLVVRNASDALKRRRRRAAS